MIRIQRTATPTILSKKGSAWTQALINADTPAKKQNAEKKYRHPEIKKALVAMFHGKCAYCESKISHIAYGHIEHFRPKSRAKYRSLTFSWSNLFLSCPICNGSEYKGNLFPEGDEGGPPINPCDDNPNKHLDFIFDKDARLTTVVGKSKRGKLTEHLFGLNRAELRDYRSRFITQIYVLLSYAKTDPKAFELVQEACKDEAEYAAFVRYLQTKN